MYMDWKLLQKAAKGNDGHNEVALEWGILHKAELAIRIVKATTESRRFAVH
jgi:hypothetical protein